MAGISVTVFATVIRHGEALRHKSLSAWQAFLSEHRDDVDAQSLGSQKPVGLAGISVKKATEICKTFGFDCHKSLSAWQAFLSHRTDEEAYDGFTLSQKPVGLAGISVWRFKMEQIDLVDKSQKPVGLAGISVSQGRGERR